MLSIKTEDWPEKVLPFLKHWGFTLFLLPCCWLLANQYWMALKWEISFAYRHSYPFLFAPFFFITDNFLLLIHEAGHTLFGFFGIRTLTIMGGTLLEVLLPLGMVLYAWKTRKKWLAQLSLFLTGFAWIESGAYAADAVARRMPLIGNLPKSAHDFYNLFTRLNLMDSYMTVAWTMYFLGILCLVICLSWPLFKPKEEQYVNLEIDL